MIKITGYAFITILIAATSAQAQGGLNCEKFKKNADGSWTPKEIIAIRGRTGTIDLDPRESYKAGKELPGLGLDIARALDAQCK